MVACEVCLTEIPGSAARSVEASDYVHHFCGLDCLERWQANKKTGHSQGGFA
ncbi:MAG: DUF3330 domain-containing protein [Pseudomonadota bacterium]